MSKSTTEIRQLFLDFFKSKGHEVVKNSSLVPNNDPTLLFTNAGMNQFKDVFLGLEKRSYRRAVTSQYCVRAGGKHNDLDHVGYTARHHTFFEMLGNFSFGDYFKYSAIQFAWELLTGKQWFNLPKEKLWVTVYITDDEAYNIWAKEIIIPKERIIRIGDNKGGAYVSDNFWYMGDTGPCGPCSEIFYDHGDHIGGGPPGSIEENGDRYIEIWNLVFMQFYRQVDGTLVKLSQQSVDTGMGLERITAVIQHVNSNYDIDLFRNLINATAEVIGTRNLNSQSLRVIADHIRTCSFLISDGVIPSSEGRGYVLRRIIRRAIRHGKILDVKGYFLYKLVAPLIEIMGDTAKQLQQQQVIVEEILQKEEVQFARTLKHGLILLDKEIAKLTGNTLDGEVVFRLHDTYGFPRDFTADICREQNIRINEDGFKRSMCVQRNRARKLQSYDINCNSQLFVNQTTYFFGYEQLEHQGYITMLIYNNQSVDVISQGDDALVILNETSFYAESGGQVGDSGVLKTSSGVFEVIDTQKYGKVLGHYGKLNHGQLKLGVQVIAQVNSKRRKQICLNHSATHMLHMALRQVLGAHIKQTGSLVNDHHLRFDFYNQKAMTPQQIRRVEEIVNEQIRCNVSIKTEIMSLENARNNNKVIGLFNEKYEAYVRVLSIGDFSTELCCGTHVSRTGDIGLFYIISESSIAAGIRRIEAVTGEIALNLLHEQHDIVQDIIHLVKGDKQTLLNKVRVLQEHSRKLEQDIQHLKKKQVAQEITLLYRYLRYISGVKVLVSQLDNIESLILRAIVVDLKNQLGSVIIVLATVVAKKITLIVGVTKDLTNRIQANDIIKYLAQQIDGKGGGHSGIAQATGTNVSALSNALISVDKMLSSRL